MSGPLSSQIIRDMTMDERIDRLDEIKRWLGAGSPEGQPAPLGPHVRPDGHQFTDAELRQMDPEDIDMNRAAILAQATAPGGLPAGPGDIDQGTRGDAPRPITRDDLRDMTPDQIQRARHDGLLDGLLQGSSKGGMIQP